MFSWIFGDWEYLTIMVSLVYAKDIYINENRFHQIIEDYNETTVEKIFNLIKEKPYAINLFNKTINALQKEELKEYGAEKGKPSVIEKGRKTEDISVFIKIPPLEFLYWMNNNKLNIPSFLIKAAQTKEKILHEEKIIANYKKRKLQQKELKLLLHEPLWYLPTAILYLNGFSTCGNVSMDQKCVEENSNLNKIYEYALDAKKIKNLNLSNKWIEFKEYYQVKPNEFIDWTKTLNIEFPIFQLLDNSNCSSADPIKGHAKYTTPYLDLMKEAINNCGITNDNQPVIKILVDWFQQRKISGKPISLRMAQSMATLIRLPEMQKGGNRSVKKAKRVTLNTKIKPSKKVG